MNTKANQPLTGEQKKRLMAMSRAAFKLAIQRGAIDDDTDFDSWRKSEYGRACELPSLGLRDAIQGQYRLIRGWLHVILGNAEAAFHDFLEGSQEDEARRQCMWHLAASVSGLASYWAKERKLSDEASAQQAWAYCLDIARDKASGRPLAQLTAVELRNMAFTMINRTNAFRGVGSAENRNKSQRASLRARPLQKASVPRITPPVFVQTSVTTRD